jgi:hypothetical protein
MQWANLIITKTRQSSIVQQGMANWVLNGALVVETMVAAILIYTPIVPQYFGIYPLEPGQIRSDTSAGSRQANVLGLVLVATNGARKSSLRSRVPTV